MTLALLLTAVTGAWAQGTLNVVEIAVPAAWETDQSNMTAGDLPDFKASTFDEAKAWTDAPTNGRAFLIYAFDGNVAHYVIFEYGEPSDGDGVWTFTKNSVFSEKSEKKFYYTAEAPLAVAWNASTKTGTFAMPGSDVVLTPIYAKAAAFATTGTEPDVKTLLPEAAEGVIAGTDASLIAEGTGIVAFAAASTEVTQGTLMYAIGTSATQAPALTDFSATVPTAKTVADDGADVYVWYYIKGADAPVGDAATLDNTFNDTEPACLTVTVLTNKFDIQFNAANANTIEAGKATVTVGGTAATVTEGKLEGVKMGSEVKMTAKEGYKFRKVEVKKKAAAKPLANATTEDLGKVIGADGNIYDTKAAAEAANTTAVAMIAYVGSETADDTYTNGLAIALADESGTMNWNTAVSTCANKTAVTGAKWMLPKVEQVHMMCIACGGYPSRHFGLDNAIATAGGNKMLGTYWTSSQKEGRSNRYYDFSFNEDSDSYSENDSNYAVTYLVRACLAF